MKNVVITGVSRGLGKELFHHFLSNGYSVYGVVRRETSFLKKEMSTFQKGKIILADISNDESIDILQNEIQDKPIDLLINNAGIGGKAFNLDKVESKEILDLLNVHCLGALRVIKALETNLLQSENPIVLNMNSRFGSITRQSNKSYKHLSVSYSYRIAKAAQNMLTNCLKNEFDGRIQFISLHPGKMKTEIAQEDANLDPSEVSKQILQYYTRGMFSEEHGIRELGKGLIEW